MSECTKFEFRIQDGSVNEGLWMIGLLDDVMVTPNDPSSPTPSTNAPEKHAERDGGVRCSAWLGDVIHREVMETLKNNPLLPK